LKRGQAQPVAAPVSNEVLQQKESENAALRMEGSI
jgi:hypothetical protein